MVSKKAIKDAIRETIEETWNVQEDLGRLIDKENEILDLLCDVLDYDDQYLKDYFFDSIYHIDEERKRLTSAILEFEKHLRDER